MERSVKDGEVCNRVMVRLERFGGEVWMVSECFVKVDG